MGGGYVKKLNSKFFMGKKFNFDAKTDVLKSVTSETG